MPAQDSAKESGKIFNIVKPIFDFLFGKDVITHAIFRKMAHMGEFFVLSVLCTFLFFEPWPVVFSFSVASIDEIIQVFTPGRGPAFKDVLIDTSGAILGTLVVLLIFLVLENNN